MWKHSADPKRLGVITTAKGSSMEGYLRGPEYKNILSISNFILYLLLSALKFCALIPLGEQFEYLYIAVQIYTMRTEKNLFFAK